MPGFKNKIVSCTLRNARNQSRFSGILFGGILLFFIGCTGSNTTEKSKSEQISSGKALFQSALCFTCHSLEGKKMYGPPLDSILNTSIRVIENGKEKMLLVDDNYIRNAIQNPNAEKVLGFQNQTMPEPTLTSDQIDDITAYLIFVNEQKQQKQQQK